MPTPLPGWRVLSEYLHRLYRYKQQRCGATEHAFRAGCNSGSGWTECPLYGKTESVQDPEQRPPL